MSQSRRPQAVKRLPPQAAAIASAAAVTIPNSATIPPEAAQWLSAQFGIDSRVCANHTLWNRFLTAPQLRRILCSLLEFDFFEAYRKRRRVNRARHHPTKAEMIEEIRQSFYLDEECSCVNRQAMKVLARQIAAAAAPSSLPPASTRSLAGPAACRRGGAVAGAPALPRARTATNPAPPSCSATLQHQQPQQQLAPYPVYRGSMFGPAVSGQPSLLVAGNSGAISSSAASTAVASSASAVASTFYPLAAADSYFGASFPFSVGMVPVQIPGVPSAMTTPVAVVAASASGAAAAAAGSRAEASSICTKRSNDNLQVPPAAAAVRKPSPIPHSVPAGGDPYANPSPPMPLVLQQMLGGLAGTSPSDSSAAASSFGSSCSYQSSNSNRSTPLNGDGGGQTLGPIETTPQNALESRLLVEVMAVGCTDPKEILESIRKLVDARSGGPPQQPQQQQQQPITGDEVLYDILQARDEANFARDMDTARLASERDRYGEAEERRRASAARHDEELLDATATEWVESKDMFRDSWLLRSSCRAALLSHITHDRSPLKKNLIELLKLEKKSRKWYGHDLPRYYFDWVLAEKLRRINDARSLEVAVKREADYLLEGLMLLSNQEGSVPQIFLQAKEEWLQRNGGVDEAAGSDDGEVILVEVRRPAHTSRVAADIVDVL